MTIHDANPAGAENPAVGHERRDVQIRPVVLLGLGLLALVIVALAAVWALDVGYRTTQEDGLVLPTAAQPVDRLPPEPRLKANPEAEWAAYRAEQLEELETYGWVDRQRGVYRLPIERAKELLLERGLPARTGATDEAPAATP